MSERTPAWGVDPVPERLRVLGALDQGLLWGSLGVSLLVLVAGALLVPALSLPRALLAIAVGGVIGATMLGVAGAIGAQARVPAMVLLRAPLGHRGSYVPTALNVIQNLGWATFELLVIATAAAALSERLLGVGAQWAWTVAFGAAAAAMALLGPISVVRRLLRRFAVWIVLASLAYLTWWALEATSPAALWDGRGTGALSTWEGIDLVVALVVSWVPLAADYTRFSRTPRAAFVGTAAGYLVASTWMFALGAVLLLGGELTDPGALPAAVAAAGVASALALLALTVDETDEAFANVYSAAVSFQNLVPTASQRALVLAASAVATTGALVLDLVRYETFLFLLGSFFVPLFGVLLAHWLLAGRRYSERDLFAAPPARTPQLVAWLAGFALYQWLHPLGPAWWTSLVERTSPPDFGLGATLPSFAAAFALGLLAGLVSRRARPASLPA
ncbi:MAG: cytosine permease [Thermoleophilia bacterium]|nr:cytosine permease [Thermoleophilia bacterium]